MENVKDPERLKELQRQYDAAVSDLSNALQLDPAHFYVEKTITGSFMGSNRFQIDAPRYLDLYRQHRLDLDAMISARLPLDRLDDALAALEKGEVTRTVITFDI